MKSTSLLLLISILALHQLYPSGRNTANEKVVAVRTNSKIIIDGKLNEQIWQRPGSVGLEQADPDSFQNYQELSL